MSLTLHYAARSDRGLIREANEDSVYAGPRLLAVADGMGGMAAGEVASNIVIATLEQLDKDAASGDLINEFRRSVETANQQLRDAVEANHSLEGMGTTLTALLFSGTRIAVGHVGDSRAYVFRESELTQITRDDTYVQMLVDEGRITSDEASTHPQRSLLTRALDGRDIEPEFSIREALPGDRYLLCSDGLSGVVSAETIAEALRIEDPDEAADRLVALALRGGAPDNVTCVVADIVTSPMGDNEPIVAGAAAHDRGRTNSATADSAAGRAALAASAEAAAMVDGAVESAGAEPATAAETSGESSEEAQPKAADGTDDGTTPPETNTGKKRVRALIAAGIIVLIVVASASAGWYYTQQQYYVGPVGPESDGDSRYIAIHRGVAGSILGVDFSSVVEKSDIRLSDLPVVQRRDVEKIVTADSKAEAREILDRLDDRLLPTCEMLREAAKSTEGQQQQPSGEQPGEGQPSPTEPGQDTKNDETPLVLKVEPGTNCREVNSDGQGTR